MAGMTTDKNSQELDKSIFSAQSATIDGKITKVNENSIMITSKSGVSDEFTLGSNLSINKLDSGDKMINSNKKADIESEKDVIVFLNYDNGNYIVTTITYTPPVVNKVIPVPPVGSSSAVRATPRPQN